MNTTMPLQQKQQYFKFVLLGETQVKARHKRRSAVYIPTSSEPWTTRAGNLTTTRPVLASSNPLRGPRRKSSTDVNCGGSRASHPGSKAYCNGTKPRRLNVSQPEIEVDDTSVGIIRRTKRQQAAFSPRMDQGNSVSSPYREAPNL